MRKRIVLAILVLSVLLSSCEQFFNSFLNLTVLATIWEIECVPNDMYSESAPIKPSLLLNIKVYFAEDLKAKNIESVRAYMSNHPEISYDIDVNKYFNEKEHYLGGLTRFWLEENVNEIQLGTMFIEITLSGGKEFLTTTQITAHGYINGGDGRMYNVDEETIPVFNHGYYMKSLSRVVIDSMSVEDNKVITKFTEKEYGTGNGWITFYDWTGSYVGTSGIFIDQRSYTVSDNFKLPYYNYSGQNTVTLESNDIYNSDGKALTNTQLNSIRHCRVVTVNTHQQIFVDNPLHIYSCKAYSKYY